MKKLFFLYILLMVLYSCNNKTEQENNSRIDIKRETIGMFEYNIKDTISKLYISHHECTECLDAWVDSGQLFISEDIHKKLLIIYNQKGSGFLPNGKDLYLVGEEKIEEKLFGDSTNFMELWQNKYVISGKAVDVKKFGIIFRVDDYRKLN